MIIHEVEPISVDESVYRSDPAYSASDLKLLVQQSPKALWNSKFNELAPPRLATPAMKLGSMVHKAVLEPDDFDNKYVFLEEKRTKEGKKLALEYDAKGLSTFNNSDKKLIDSIKLALTAHPVAHKILSKGKTEQ